jgi:polyisoprenoid-binding protein YceI
MKCLLSTAVLLAALPALAQVETLTVDPRHTFPSYEIMHNGYSFQRGRFNRTTGKITLDMQAKKGSAEIAIDAASVSTGVEKLEEHIRSDDFLKATAHPQITFKSSHFVFDGDVLKKAIGDLTIAGVTRPVALDVHHFHCSEHKTTKVKTCGAELTTTIRRSDFGIRYGLPALADDMLLRIGIEARADRPAA